MNTSFAGGRNIAMKVPPHHYDQTVRFYRDVLGLEQIEPGNPDISFAFGANRLWIDRVETVSQAELWLELTADDVPAAADRLAEAGVVRCDAIEKLPDGFTGFWIANPAAVVHLVSARRAAGS